MNLQMAITLAVLIISIALYIWGKIPYLAISLAAPIVLFFCGIVTADEIFGHLTNKGLLMSIGMFVCGGALISSGAAETFGYFVTKRLKNERTMIVAFFALAACLSTFINNIAAAMVFIPIVMGICQTGRAKPSRLMLPLAIGCSMGGMNSLIGQPLNILANGQLENAGIQTFSFFEFAKVGVPLCIVSVAYMYFFGYKLLPVKDSEVNYEQPERTSQSIWKKIVSAVVFVTVIISIMLESKTKIPMHISTTAGAAVLIFTGVLGEKQAVSFVDFGGVLMVVSMMSVATALGNTGATVLVAEKITGVFGANSSPFLFCTILLVLAAILTNFISNTACCALLMPMGIAISQTLGCNPKAVAMAVIVGSTMAFATPVGTHCNTVVIGYGGYKYKDYVRFGLPVTLIWLVGACLLLPVIWKF